jgi:hypothetical protein
MGKNLETPLHITHGLYFATILLGFFDDNLLMVDDAPGMDVNLFQGLAYHIVVRHDSWPCCYLVQLQMCYISKLKYIRVVVFLNRVFWTVDDFMSQDLKNLHLGFTAFRDSRSSV